MIKFVMISIFIVSSSAKALDATDATLGLVTVGAGTGTVLFPKNSYLAKAKEHGIQASVIESLQPKNWLVPDSKIAATIQGPEVPKDITLAQMQNFRLETGDALTVIGHDGNGNAVTKTFKSPKEAIEFAKSFPSKREGYYSLYAFLQTPASKIREQQYHLTQQARALAKAKYGRPVFGTVTALSAIGLATELGLVKAAAVSVKHKIDALSAEDPQSSN